MAYKTLDPMNVNTPVTSTYLNQIRDNFAALLNPPMIIAHRGNETVLGSGNPVIALTSALKDTMPQWGHSAGWVVGQANYIFLRRPGWYWVFANAMFASSALDYRMQILQYPDIVRSVQQPNIHAAEAGVSMSCVVQSDGTDRMFLQAAGTTNGLTMRAGATLGAIWFSE